MTSLTKLHANFGTQFVRRMAAFQASETEEVTSPKDTVELAGKSEVDVNQAIAHAALSAAQVAGVTAGGAAAIAIARELGKELITPELRGEFRGEIKKHMQAVETEPEVQDVWDEIKSHSELEDAQLVRMADGDNSPLALFGDVYLSTAAKRQFSAPAERAFALGHELAHLETKDSEQSAGMKFLREALAAVEQTDEVKALSVELKVQTKKLSHQEELAADKRGFQIALAMGHNPVAAIGFLEGMRASDHHPSGNDRIRALAGK